MLIHATRWITTHKRVMSSVSGILVALRKGWEMADCMTDGCGNVAQVTVTKTERVVPTLEVRRKRVCTDCAGEMKALYGWEISGEIDRLRLVR